MSLLHEALKKAEEEKGELPKGEAFVDLEEPEKKRPIRVYLLAGLTALSLLLVIYLEFFPQRGGGSGANPATLIAPERLSGNVEQLALQAEARVKTGDWNEAKQFLEQWVLFEPLNAEAYNNLGLAYKKTGDRERAREHYRKALAIRPDYPETLNNLGVLYLSEGKLTEAEDHFLRALQAKPEYADPLFHLALIQEAQGRGVQARENFEKFLALTPGLEGNFSAEIQERMRSIASEEDS